MQQNNLEEASVPTLLRLVLLVSNAAGAAPVSLRRARSRWLLALSPRRALAQRLTAVATGVISLSSTIFVLRGDIRTTKLYNVFSLTGYIGYSERTLTVLAYISGMLSAPARVRRIVSLLQQLRQITYYVDSCGITSTIQTRRLSVNFVKCYLIWQIFVQLSNITFLSLGFTSNQNLAYLFNVPLYYQKLVVILLELQWVLTVVEICYAIVKVNDKIEQHLKNIPLMHSMNQNFELPREFPRCYEVICNLVQQMNQEDGLFLLLSFTILFLRMLLSLINLISAVAISISGTAEQYLFTVREASLCITLSMKLLFLVDPCHWTQYELERTYRLLSKISSEIKRIRGQVSIEIDHFALVAQTRDAQFSPMGVFPIRRSIITTIIGGLITYSVIIIQMQNVK